MPLRSLLLALFLPALALGEPGPAPVVVLKADHADGAYAVGETATWTVTVTAGDLPALAAVPYVISKDGSGADAVRGTLDLSSGSATLTATRAEPGCLLVTVNPATPPAKPYGLGGAIFGAGQIAPARPAPDDFDAFWQAKLAELAAVPPNPVVEKVDLAGTKNAALAQGVDYSVVTLDNIRGTKVRGQLARPAAGDKFPAMLIVQWAGVYSLDPAWVLGAAKEGFLVLNIQAHDIPPVGKPEVYTELAKGALKDYVRLGSEDRETSYFTRMFMGDVRAADYLASRPDWDGKVLFVNGTSQGGLQSFATAALDPKVTHLSVLVPAGCDVYAPFAVPPRALSWPNWLSTWGPQDRDMEKVKATAGYFDAIYFAARAKCPALVAPGLLDETARPAGIAAAFNALPNPQKELLFLPASNHHGEGGAQGPYIARFAAWKKAILAGAPVPPPVSAP